MAKKAFRLALILVGKTVLASGYKRLAATSDANASKSDPL
jgi:hypothetical protein